MLNGSYIFKNDVSIDDIETIASICVLLAIKFNECYKPYIKEDNLTKDENYVYFFLISKTMEK